MSTGQGSAAVEVAQQQDFGTVVDNFAMDVQDERRIGVGREVALGIADGASKPVLAKVPHTGDPTVVGSVQIGESSCGGGGVLVSEVVDGRSAEVVGVACAVYAHYEVDEQPGDGRDRRRNGLGVTTRTVRRDVDRLRNLGYPVDAAPGADDGYQLGVGGHLPPLLLDDEEATAVAVALAASTAAATLGIEDVAIAALAKLHRLLPPRIRTRVQTLSTATDLLTSQGQAVAPSLLVVLAVAIDGDERVILIYADREGRRSERRVEPYRLVVTNRRWYLVAFDLDRAEWRTFRVDRIEQANPTGHRFAPGTRPDATRMVSEAISTAPYRYRATVRFSVPAAELRRRIPPTVGSITHDGAAALLRIGADHLASLAGHLVALDIPFEVLDPPELREHLRRLGQDLARNHPSERRA